MVDLVKSTETNKIIETQALALSYHIMINEEISKWLIILTKAMVNRTNFNRDRYIFYATSCGLSTSKTEKDILLDGDLTEDNIDFISEQKDTPVAMIFAGKKMLDYHLSEIKQLSIPIRFID
jgi:hypothetical protein